MDNVLSLICFNLS